MDVSREICAEEEPCMVLPLTIDKWFFVLPALTPDLHRGLSLPR